MQEPSYSQAQLDVVNQAIVAGSQRTQLTPKAFAVLNHLHRHAGQLVSKDELLESVWPRVYVGDAVLKVAVREIRKALHDDPRDPLFIETVHRRGYRLIGSLARTERSMKRPVAPESGTVPTSHIGGLIGREQPLKALTRYWQGALQGKPQLVFINGLPGIGKTSLAETWIETITSREPYVYAKGYCVPQQMAAEAYLPVLDALGLLSRGSDRAHLKASLAQYAPGWLWQLPWLIDESERSHLQQQMIGSTPQRMMRELIEFLATFSTEHAMILLLEDLHWSDLATLDMLDYYARRAGQARCMILATVDMGSVSERSHPLRRIQREHKNLPGCHMIDLDVLPRGAVEAYVQHRCPGLSNQYAQVLYDRSSGHPLFVSAAIDAAIEEGALVKVNDRWQLEKSFELSDIKLPEQLQSILEQQLARLQMTERHVLDAASVVRHWFAAEAVAAMLDYDVADVETICEDFVWRGTWLQDADSREWPDGTLSSLYGFQNSLYREYLYRQLSAARRRRLHHRLAKRLDKAYRGKHQSIAADLAYHYEWGGDKQKAIEFYRTAADVDCTRFAPREALQHIECAIGLMGTEEDTGDLLLQHCELLAASGQIQAATSAYQALVNRTVEAGQLELQIKATLGLASVLFWLDRKHCLVVAQQAQDLSRAIENPSLKAHVHGWTAHWRTLIQGYQAASNAAYREAVKQSQDAGQEDCLCQHLALLSYWQTLHSDYETSAETAQSGLALAVQLGDGQHYLACQFFRAWALFYAGCWGDMLDAMEDGFTIASKNGHLPWIAHFQLQQAWFALHIFDYETALAQSQSIVDQNDKHGLYGSEFFLGSIIKTRAYIGLQRCGEAGACVNTVLAQLQRAPESIDWILRLPLQQTLSDYHLACGSIAQAQIAAQTLQELAAGPTEKTYLGSAYVQQAYCAFAQDDQSIAPEYLENACRYLADAPTLAWRVFSVMQSKKIASGMKPVVLASLSRLSHSLAEHPKQQAYFMNALKQQGVKMA